MRDFAILPIAESMHPIRGIYKQLSGSKSVLARRLHQVPRVVYRQDTYVARPAELKPVDPAVRCDDPRRRFGASMDGTEQVKCKKTDRPSVRKYSDPLALVVSKYIAKFAGDSLQQMSIAFALGDYVVNVSIDQGVVITRKLLFRFVKCQALEHADITFAKCFGLMDRQIEYLSQRLGGLNGAIQIARVNDMDAFLC